MRFRTIALWIFACFMFVSAKSQGPTWADDVACIIYENCTSCHNQNGIAPFALMRYEDAQVRAQTILYYVENRIMPPWPPDPSYSEMLDQRYLSDTEIAIIRDWVDNGTAEGNPDHAPRPPVIESNELISDPDFVVELPEYTSRAVEGDEYRCFVVQSSLATNKFITGLEIVPGNRNIVHHVLVFQDESQRPIQLDASDPEPGYVCFGGVGSNAAQLIGGWVPGQTASFYPEGMGIELPANTNIVVQLHYPHGSAGLIDQTKINLRLSDDQSLRNIRITPFLNHVIGLVNGPLHIPANTVRDFREQWPVTTRITMLGAAPHMHLIGRSIKAYALDPMGDTIKLVNVPEWNFEWQGFYNFKRPVVIPTGSTLVAEATYDNTNNNPFNPNNPPLDVSVGEATTDEMMLVYTPWLIYQEGDEDLIFEDSPAPGSPDCEAITDTEDHALERNIKIFPNPIREDAIHMRILDYNSSDPLTFQLFDAQGRIVFSESTMLYAGQDLKWNIPMTAGVYILRIQNQDGQSLYSERIVRL